MAEDYDLEVNTAARGDRGIAEARRLFVRAQVTHCAWTCRVESGFEERISIWKIPVCVTY